MALGYRGGQKGSPLNASGKRTTPTSSQEKNAKPSIPSLLVSRLATEPVVTLKVEETDFEFIVDTGAAISIVKPNI